MAPKRRANNRYVIIHGHFYQPPRENPWIEAIERQPGAAPHHDWNEVVTWECYLPNMVSRVINGSGKIVDLVNNYRHISFNFGPTLLAWLEHAFPDVYSALLEADRLSAAANGGHGNAMAQAYNHMILPLANERDRRTQILWGVEDFRRRFGRDPEGMWLPETAVNNATLAALVASGIKFIVLAPGQAWRYRPVGARDWHNVADGSIDPRQAYRLVIEGEKGNEPKLEGELAAFFYDGGLAHSIAFDRLLMNSAQLADRIELAFGAPMLAPARLVNVATDGETYGHHRRFSDMALAHVAKYELPKREITLTNYAAFLAQFPPQFEVELKPGRDGQGTSWSCVHGVDRWQADCGCWTGSTGGQQKWRAPMRKAFDQLRDEAAALFELEGRRLLKDPWAARDDYIHLILDRGEPSVAAFMGRHLAVADEQEARVQALKWLESQRQAMLMYTSCGWFFDEISRPEPVQVMLYACRAAQLVRSLTGRDLEPKLVEALAQAPGNLKLYPTGKDVYEKLVKPSALNWERLVAHHAITVGLGADGAGPDRLYHYAVEHLDERRFGAEGALFVAARVRLTSGVTRETQQAMYLLVHLGEDRVRCYVTLDGSEAIYAKVVARLEADAARYLEIGIQSLARPLFPGEALTLSDLLYDERERLIHDLLQDRLGAAAWQLLDLFRDNMGLLKRYHDVGWKVPDVLRVSSEYALGEALADRFKEHGQHLNRERVRDLVDMIALARDLDFAPQLERATLVFEQIVLGRVRTLCDTVNLDTVRALHHILELERELTLGARLYRAQNEFFNLIKCQVPWFNGAAQDAAGTAPSHPGNGRQDSEEIRRLLTETADHLNFDLTAIRQSAAQQ
ncbi:MAG: DUF3536 domain-containing protein [Verrucomicrobia bacterium]|nr:DUF3536 domain-containing protein [Verrucomicrobiota bacterium]